MSFEDNAKYIGEYDVYDLDRLETQVAEATEKRKVEEGSQYISVAALTSKTIKELQKRLAESHGETDSLDNSRDGGNQVTLQHAIDPKYIHSQYKHVSVSLSTASNNEINLDYDTSANSSKIVADAVISHQTCVRQHQWSRHASNMKKAEMLLRRHAVVNDALYNSVKGCSFLTRPLVFLTVLRGSKIFGIFNSAFVMPLNTPVEQRVRQPMENVMNYMNITGMKIYMMGLKGYCITSTGNDADVSKSNYMVGNIKIDMNLPLSVNLFKLCVLLKVAEGTTRYQVLREQLAKYYQKRAVSFRVLCNSYNSMVQSKFFSTSMNTKVDITEKTIDMFLDKYMYADVHYRISESANIQHLACYYDKLYSAYKQNLDTIAQNCFESDLDKRKPQSSIPLMRIVRHHYFPKGAKGNHRLLDRKDLLRYHVVSFKCKTVVGGSTQTLSHNLKRHKHIDPSHFNNDRIYYVTTDDIIYSCDEELYNNKDHMALEQTKHIQDNPTRIHTIPHDILTEVVSTSQTACVTHESFDIIEDISKLMAGIEVVLVKTSLRVHHHTNGKSQSNTQSSTKKNGGNR